MRKLALIVFLLFTCSSYSQDIYIIVKRGSATLDSEKLTAEKGVRKLGDKSKLILSENSLVLAKQNKKLIQIKEPRGYKTSQIIQLLAKQTEFSTSSYISVLFSDQMQKPAPVIQSGSVTRGGSAVNWEELVYSPASGAKLMNGTLKIVIENAGVIMGDSISIVSKETKKVLTLTLDQNGQCNLDGLAPGVYEWSIGLTAEVDEVSVQNYLLTSAFRIPDSEQLATMKLQESDFLKSISLFDLEIQEVLKEEFYSSRNWIR